MSGDRPLPGLDAFADEAACACGWRGRAADADRHVCDLPEPDADPPCEVCTARLMNDTTVVAHLDLGDGALHVFRWDPPGWSAVFGGEGGVLVIVGADEQPLSVAEVRRVAHALLEAADRAGG